MRRLFHRAHFSNSRGRVSILFFLQAELTLDKFCVLLRDMRPFILFTVIGVFCAASVAADCIADPDLNAEFEALAGGPIPFADSCCQNDVCGIPCAEPVSGKYAYLKRSSSSRGELN